MLKKSLVYALSILLLLGCLFAVPGVSAAPADNGPAEGAEEKIVVTPEQLIFESGNIGNPERIFDEQAFVGDPKYDALQTVPTSVVSNLFGWNHDSLDLSLTVDLGTEYFITDIYVYLPAKKGTFQIKTGEPFAWESVQTVEMSNWPASMHDIWKSVGINRETRYINFFLPVNAYPSEAVIYGWRTGDEPQEPEPDPNPSGRLNASLDQLVGLNGFIDDKKDTLAAGRFLREYHNWWWCDSQPSASLDNFPSNTHTFVQLSGNRWDFDAYYRDLKNLGVTVAPCIQLTSSIFENGVRTAKPARLDMDATDPAAYDVYASHIYQYAARYGSTHVDQSKLLLTDGQQQLTGLGYLNYIEASNEPNQTWGGRESYFTPAELAAMMSAVYDGHEGRMGDGMGAKTADPNMKVAMGGLAGISYEYIRAMYQWAQYNRDDKKFPADALNVHHYVTKTWSDPENGITWDVSEAAHPEYNNALWTDMRQLVDWRNIYAPHAEVWLTEFGYDTCGSWNANTAIHAYGSYTIRELQAMWLVRSYLVLASAGVDRAAMYMSRDTGDEHSVGKYGSCGIITNRGEKKDSYYYLHTLSNRMAGMVFQADRYTGNENVMLQHYKNAAGNSAYVVWCPTGDGTTVSDFSIPVGGYKNMEVVSFANGSTTGESQTVAVQNGYLTLNVTEKPLMVFEGEKSEAQTYFIEIESSGGGTVNKSLNGLHPVNTQLTLLAEADFGHRFVGWYNGERLVSTQAAYQIILQDNVVLEAKFERETYTVTILAENGRVTGAGSYSYGDTAALTAVPDEGYRFAGWYLDGLLQQSSTVLTLSNLSRNYALEARFVPTSPDEGVFSTISIGTLGAGDVAVNGQPINGERVDNGVEHGTKYTLAATPQQGSEFLYWIDTETDRIISYYKNYSFYVSGSRSIAGVFQQSREAQGVYAVTFLDANERVLYTDVYDSRNPDDSIRSRTANPLGGHTFLGWKKKGWLDANRINLDTYTFTQNLTLMAVYQATADNVRTVTLSGGSFIDTSQTQKTVPFGSAVQVRADAQKDGVRFAFWLRDGKDIVSYDPAYRFFAVLDCTLEAVYMKDSFITAPILTISDCAPDAQAGSASFFIDWVLPEGTELVAAGVLWTDQTTYEGFDALDDFAIDQPNVVKRTSNISSLVGQYQWIKTGLSPGERVYARGYVVFHDAQKNLQVLYTDVSEGGLLS